MKLPIRFAPFVLIAFSCQNPAESTSSEPEESERDSIGITEKYTPLRDTLNAKKVLFEAHADAEKKRDYAAGIRSVAESGILESALQVGDTAANFSLTNAMGETVRLAEYLEKGPVVLTWYRGGWCPYCNLTLQRLQQELSGFESAGAKMLALTPEVPDSSMTTKEKLNLDFEVLSDIDNEVGKSYGVVYALTDAVAKRYQGGFNLNMYNGNESAELPLAATYVIDQNGVIRYSFLDADYRNRAEPRDIRKALEDLR